MRRQIGRRCFPTFDVIVDCEANVFVVSSRRAFSDEGSSENDYCLSQGSLVQDVVDTYPYTHSYNHPTPSRLDAAQSSGHKTAQKATPQTPLPKVVILRKATRTKI